MNDNFTVKFVPNKFARQAFNLQASEYTGDGVTAVLKASLGEENIGRYLTPGFYFGGARTEEDLKILPNADESGAEQSEFLTIGKLIKLTR